MNTKKEQNSKWKLETIKTKSISNIETMDRIERTLTAGNERERERDEGDIEKKDLLCISKGQSDFALERMMKQTKKNVLHASALFGN